MPVQILHPDHKKGIIFRCHGLLTGKELIDGLEHLFSGNTLKNAKYAIIDEVEVESLNITNADIASIVKQHKKMAAIVTKNAVVAIIAPTFLGFGLGRVWQGLSADIHWVSKVFMSAPEADIWVKDKVKEHFDLAVTLKN